MDQEKSLLETGSFENAHQAVPTRGLIISFLALFATCLVYLVWPTAADRYVGLVWIFSLIPIFLLSYYKGLKGTALAATATMIAFAMVELISIMMMNQKLDWWLYGVVVGMLIVVSLFTGWLSNKLIEERHEAMQLAFKDPLTRLASRRALDFYFDKQVESARRGEALSVAFFDLDDFKHYNDEYGHDAGDQILRRMGQVMQENTREGDITGRFGGEEFLSVLPGETEVGAKVFAQRMCSQIAEMDSPYPETPTISAGVASWDGDVEGKEDLLRRADQALYRAKEKGGNMVEAWSEIDESEQPEGVSSHIR